MLPAIRKRAARGEETKMSARDRLEKGNETGPTKRWPTKAALQSEEKVLPKEPRSE